MKTPYHCDDPAWRKLAIVKITRLGAKTKPAHVFGMCGVGEIRLPTQLDLELVNEIQGMLRRGHSETDVIDGE